MDKEKLLKKYSENTSLSSLTTVNDIEEKEIKGIPLSDDEQFAIRAFRKLRLQKLVNKVNNEDKFHEQFEYIQALGNIVDYREFLKERSDFFNI